ncbi:MAG: diguanylate cyclase, partial [Methyloprofundus sp.]|nr:diguanylate cyclase [Methyloprofundus sp.]
MNNKQELFVAGIGTSAGGLEPLRSFVKKLQPTGNMAYIIAQHTAQEPFATLDSLLERDTRLKVVNAENQMQLLADTLYILPYIKGIHIKDGKIKLSKADTTTQPPRPSIDQLFTCLAGAYGDHAIGIIFSGSGADGARGCEEIKSAGGLTIAQSPSSAKFDSMPKMAIHLASVDLVLTAEQTADKLMLLANNPELLSSERDLDLPPETSNEIIEKILKKTGIDFVNYKTTTINRQINRRMALLHISDIKEYGKYFNDNPDETTLLANNFLVCVTSFFRDDESYQSLKRALHEIIKSKKIGDEIRIWIPACATGEEAYSIGILLAEELGPKLASFRVQIFATDINPHTVQFARKASYTETSLSKMPQHLRDKYFTRQQQGYTANQVLSEMMIFSQHNVLQDPPFIRVDLVSCRNLLIYLTQESQQRLLKIFHYTLITNGLLFLGHSETVGNLSNAFAEYDKKHKLYIKQNSHFFHPILNKGITPPLTIVHNPRRLVTNEMEYRRLGEQKIVELYAKPAILATQQGEILEFYNDCAPFIQVKPGSADFNLFSILDPLFRTEIKALLYQARHAKNGVMSQPIPLFIEERQQLFRLHFNLLDSPLDEEQLILISFDNAVNTDAVKATDLQPDSELVTGLKHELNIRRETLHTVTEALETSILELQSLNEEAQVSNEELQSTNEELETSNEELQSTNEELSVLNDALAEKSEELEDINDDFENVLNSIQNAVLVIDEKLIIHQFNETSRHFFNFERVGNQLPNLSSIEAFFHAETLIGKVRQVIKTGVVFQDTLVKQSQYYELLIYPYLNKRGKNKSRAVITIKDITDRHKAEQKIHTAAQVFDAASEGIMITDKEQRMVSVNPAFTLITGYEYNEVIGKSPRLLSSGRQGNAFYLQMWDSINTTGKWQGKIWNQNKKGDIYPEWLSISSLADKEGKPNGYIGIFSDITSLVKAEQMILQQANFDALTQLPNRNLFFDRLQQAMLQAKRQNSQLGIMFIDLDGFKVINDSLGHSQGDIILQQIAERMRQVSRESDIFARFGGDEFTCLINNIKSASDIIPFVEKLLQAIDTPVTVKGITLHITASIGISIYPDNGDDAETLIKHADNAMYKAKDDGRNTYQFFTSQMHEQVLNHYRMGNDLKFAIKHNTFQIYYQPVVELKTLRIVG